MSTTEKEPAKHVEGVEDNRLAEAQQMSPEELLDTEKSLKRKLDIRLLFCVWVIFVMNYLDRVRASHAPCTRLAEQVYDFHAFGLTHKMNRITFPRQKLQVLQAHFT